MQTSAQVKNIIRQEASEENKSAASCCQIGSTEKSRDEEALADGGYAEAQDENENQRRVRLF